MINAISNTKIANLHYGTTFLALFQSIKLLII